MAEFSCPSAYDIPGAFCGMGLSTVNSSSSLGSGGVGDLNDFNPSMMISQVASVCLYDVACFGCLAILEDEFLRDFK